ncbi:hypothetical protein KP696_32975 [Nocardia seriolae]|uniref:hypothetical protein n=1 Tax=Nocardia seriolae TaxID=37332 RepID=UPI0003F3E885|nr:hypothetical protein NS14008_19155 [Nocardia seriolae]GEM22277.1 hypothetical protein NS2_05160 [Nocardia seriolae NBRC 15557]PSK32921.1 hypothetical protein C6575_02510 [Nocardia seriolae]RLP33526.1 hypothetical protein D6158_01995 [Nocardia seriolae]BEK88549.1 hypothetical protein NSERKGN1266_45000 [Nocardia seriolae]
MEALVGRQGTQYRSNHGTLRHQRPPVRVHRSAHPVRDAVFATGWLILELPTAVLLAVFVGTGWLGYVQHTGTPTQPRSAVVVPAETAAR